MTKDKSTEGREPECLLTDNEKDLSCMADGMDPAQRGTGSLQNMYPGQPEEEDTDDETIPAAADLSKKEENRNSGDKELWDAEEDEDHTVLIPVFVTARDVILKRYRLVMYSYMNRLLRSGRLSRITGIASRNTKLNRDSLELGFMSFWRIDRSSFFADVSVRLSLDTAGGKRKWFGTLALWCRFEGEDLTCSVVGLKSGNEKRNDGLIPLSPYLVPYLRNREVDARSEEILERFLPEALDDPQARHATGLAGKMGLHVEYLPVHAHKGIQSILFWEDGEVPILDKWRVGQKEPGYVVVPKDTVIVNTNEIREEYADFYIFHECIHHELHYMACRLQKLGSNDTTKVKYEKVDLNKGRTRVDPVHFMEKQANRGAYGLMMPETSTRRMITEEYRKAEGCRHAGERYHIAGRKIAFRLLLPDFRIRTRMVQLGYIQAKGALNYVQKKPIRPFAFNPESWKDDQHTFVIDPALVDHLMGKSEELRQLVLSGRYIYADGHVVRNTPRCVQRADGRLLLTPWANAHVDECCLRFIRHYVQGKNGKYHYGRIYYDADYIRQTLFYLEDIMEMEEIDEIDAKYRFRREFPKTFREAVDMLRKKKKVSREKLAECLDTSTKTLARWLEEPWRYGGVDLIATLALTLQLPDWITALLFKRAHIQLDEDDRRHQAIMHILRAQSNDGVQAANDYLREKRLAPLNI